MPLPTDLEFDQLVDLVLVRWPQLRSPDDQSFRAQFRAAFHRLLHLGRCDKLDTERGLSYWADDCRAWLSEHQPGNALVSGAAFTAAAIAQGDIQFTAPTNFPCDLAFNLQFGGGGLETNGDAWRRVLATGKLSEPVPLPRPTEMRSRVQQLAVGHKMVVQQ